MLLYSAIVPDHPVLIPEIAGEALVQVEETVNALLKLALKIHADSPDTLIILSPKAPILHKRHSISLCKDYVRNFASHLDPTKTITLQFQGTPSDDIEKMIEMALTHKVILEGYTQEHNCVAIDDAALSLMYYLHRIESTVKVVVIGVSDMGLDGQMILGSALREFCDAKKEKIAVACLGHVEGLAVEHITAITKALHEPSKLGSLLMDMEDDVLASQSTLAFPLMTLAGMYIGKKATWHLLGEEVFGAEKFITGYLA